jgi:hypothetical protein
VLAERNGGGPRSLRFGELPPHRHEPAHSLRRSVIGSSQGVTAGHRMQAANVMFS